MPLLDQSACRNRLLALMPAEDFALLAPDLEALDLPKGFVMVEAGGIIEHVYFPETSIASIVVTSPEGHEVEAGLFGHDGMGPTPAVMGTDRMAHRSLFQVAGHGHRIRRTALVEALGKSGPLHALLLRFAQARSVQTSYTALSNAVHPIDERLARWLLMCHDRYQSDEIPLTHEFLSIMLAVRRPSVTTTLHVLEGNGFIRAERGYVTIRDRTALEEFAGDGYGQPEAEYRRLIGPMA